MEWSDDAIILASRRRGDSSVVLEVLTRSHGRHQGLVRGARSRSLAAVIQPGNRVTATWRARLDEHLGQFTIEPQRMRAANLIDVAEVLFTLQVMTGHMHLLAERQVHAGLFDAMETALDVLAGETRPTVDELCAFLARFELALLDELGFGLDLARCARTGSREGLAYVSPRTGRAVSREAAIGYEDRLLTLPPFLSGGASNRGPEELLEGLRLTAHFLQRDLYGPRGSKMPSARDELIARLSGRGDRAGARKTGDLSSAT
ncbi:DNA repair protein RecO [Kaistia algarum]|uniref:DNA repair protein RecO n=1 Tax=Kaistia algarum TaxID=2083279 RepID=UPI000CE8D108|nr:DNA repair protein RecO [Kaistia algarum]MCX5512058.1 DNA repair protein RecO [Kaistia algarum]PPE80581.1 DNA repair protein RecO [Kaistia algarum]